jgi:hypothetical protein
MPDRLEELRLRLAQTTHPLPLNVRIEELLVGGEGRPGGLDRGWFDQLTVFVGFHNDMRIAREESSARCCV